MIYTEDREQFELGRNRRRRGVAEMMGGVAFLWHPGYKKYVHIHRCPCSAHVYERQRRNLVAHVKARR